MMITDQIKLPLYLDGLSRSDLLINQGVATQMEFERISIKCLKL